MAEARIDLDVVGAADCVDRAVAAGDGVEPRLVRAQRELVAPVDAFLVPAVVGLDVESAADIRDVGIGEVAHELAQRIGLPRAVRVGERDDVAVGLANGAVLRRNLARRAGCGSRARRRASASASVRSVDASEVTTSSSSLGWIVERVKVLDPALDHRLLVVRGDDHRDRRQDIALLHGPLRERAASTRAASG